MSGITGILQILPWKAIAALAISVIVTAGTFLGLHVGNSGAGTFVSLKQIRHVSAPPPPLTPSSTPTVGGGGGAGVTGGNSGGTTNRTGGLGGAADCYATNLKRPDHIPDPIKAVAYDPSACVVASGSHGKVLVWNLSQGHVSEPSALSLSRTDSDVNALAFSGGTHLLAVGYGAGVVDLFDVSNPEVATRYASFTWHSGVHPGVVAVAFKPNDPTVLVTAGEDGTAQLWKISGKGLAPSRAGNPMRHADRISAVAFTQDGKTLATGGVDLVVKVWNVTDINQPQLLDPPLTHGGEVTAVLFVDGTHLLATDKTHVLRLWTLSSTAAPRSLDISGISQTVTHMAMDAAGVKIAISGSAGKVYTMKTQDSQPAEQSAADRAATVAVGSVAISADGRLLVSGDQKGNLWFTPTA